MVDFPVHGRASQPRSIELSTSAVSVSGSLHLSAAESSESAAHLALLSGHARANGRAGLGIKSVTLTDDQVTLRRHWRRPTKGAFQRPCRGGSKERSALCLTGSGGAGLRAGGGVSAGRDREITD